MPKHIFAISLETENLHYSSFYYVDILINNVSNISHASRCAQDNCYCEFQYAGRERPDKLVALVLEPEVKSPNTWKGKLKALLGGKLYYDFSDESQWHANVQKIAGLVLPKESELKGSNCTARTIPRSINK